MLKLKFGETERCVNEGEENAPVRARVVAGVPDNVSGAAAAVAVFIAARLIAVPAASGNSEPEEYAEYENGVITQILADNTVTDPTSDGAARGEQLLLVDVKTGQYAGETLQVYNYVGPLYGGTLKEGQGVTLIVSTYSGGTHTATVFEYNRTLPLIVIVGLFLLATVLVGGKVGAKSLVGLAVTLACLFWILIPLLMKGAPTLLTTLLVCAYITVVTLTLPVLMDGRAVNQERLGELLDTLGLRGREKHLPNQLSGGQQQRVSIGRALMNAPAVVLADEPTGNLDSRNSQEIVELLKLSNRKYGQTLVVITHDENIALQADRIIAVEDGHITRDERLREVLG